MEASTRGAGVRRREKLTLVMLDLAGFARAFHTRDDEQVADFLDDYYALCERVIGARSGTVVKFMGDGCLATFDGARAAEAIAAVMALERAVSELAGRHQLEVELGANVHLASVIAGAFGDAARPRQDVIGRGVNQTFLLGRGAGVRISEPVYRQLPNDARSPWRKQKPPATYHLAAPHEVSGADAADRARDAARW